MVKFKVRYFNRKEKKWDDAEFTEIKEFRKFLDENMSIVTVTVRVYDDNEKPVGFYDIDIDSKEWFYNEEIPIILSKLR